MRRRTLLHYLGSKHQFDSCLLDFRDHLPDGPSGQGMGVADGDGFPLFFRFLHGQPDGFFDDLQVFFLVDKPVVASEGHPSLARDLRPYAVGAGVAVHIIKALLFKDLH
jgi:hypothetical protein